MVLFSNLNVSRIRGSFDLLTTVGVEIADENSKYFVTIITKGEERWPPNLWECRRVPEWSRISHQTQYLWSPASRAHPGSVSTSLKKEEVMPHIGWHYYLDLPTAGDRNYNDIF